MPINSAGRGQRAYVDLACDEERAMAITSAFHGLELVALLFAPGAVGEGSMVVTLELGEEYTWLGRTGDPDDEVSTWAERAGPHVAGLIASAWQVQAFDPAWGRNDRLLPALIDALGAQA